MKRPVFLILFALAAANNIHAQSIGTSTLNAGGGTAVIGGNEYDWSVGEMTRITTDTTAAGTLIVTQGLLQPATFTTGIKNNSVLATQLQVFPNPASSVVNIRYTSLATEGTLAYKLTDIAGKTIMSNTADISLATTQEQLNIANLANATYMLEVTVDPGNAASQTISYKIEKRN